MDRRISRGFAALYLRSFVKADDPTSARRRLLFNAFVYLWILGVSALGFTLLGGGMEFARELSWPALLTFLDGFTLASAVVVFLLVPGCLSSELKDVRSLEMLGSLRVPTDRARPWALLYVLAMPAAAAMYVGIFTFGYLHAGGELELAPTALASAAFVLFLLGTSLVGLLLSLAFVEVLSGRFGQYFTFGVFFIAFMVLLIPFVVFFEATLDFLGRPDFAGLLNLSPFGYFVERPMMSLAVLAGSNLALAAGAYRTFGRHEREREGAVTASSTRSTPRLDIGSFRGRLRGFERFEALLRKDLALWIRQPTTVFGPLFVAAVVDACIPVFTTVAVGFPEPGSEAALVAAALFGGTGLHLAGLAAADLTYADGRCMARYVTDSGLWRAWVGAKLLWLVVILGVVAAAIWAVYVRLLEIDVAWYAAGSVLWVGTAAMGGLATALRHGIFDQPNIRMSTTGLWLYLLLAGTVIALSGVVFVVSGIHPEAAVIAGAGLGVILLVLCAGLLVRAARYARTVEF